MDKLNKIVWFYYSSDSFNYLVVRGSTSTVTLDDDELRILQHLMIKVAEELGEKIDWLTDTSSFRRNIKWSLSWAHDKKTALIFKYNPSDEVRKAKSDFDDAMWEYKINQNDKTYYEMKNAFIEFFNLL